MKKLIKSYQKVIKICFCLQLVEIFVLELISLPIKWNSKFFRMNERRPELCDHKIPVEM